MNPETFKQNKKGTRQSGRIAAAQEISVQEAAKALLELKNTENFSDALNNYYRM